MPSKALRDKVMAFSGTEVREEVGDPHQQDELQRSGDPVVIDRVRNATRLWTKSFNENNATAISSLCKSISNQFMLMIDMQWSRSNSLMKIYYYYHFNAKLSCKRKT